MRNGFLKKPNLLNQFIYIPQLSLPSLHLCVSFRRKSPDTSNQQSNSSNFPKRLFAVIRGFLLLEPEPQLFQPLSPHVPTFAGLLCQFRSVALLTAKFFLELTIRYMSIDFLGRSYPLIIMPYAIGSAFSHKIDSCLYNLELSDLATRRHIQN